MTKLIVIVLLLALAAGLSRLIRHGASPPPAPKRGCLDDDGIRRGPRWDGSWLSGQIAAAVL